MSSLVIVDSECANLNSIYKAARMVSLEAVISDNPKTISSARAIIFPGVGSFAHAASLISKKKLRESLLETVARGRPFLGICLGMHMLFSGSEEADLSRVNDPTEGLGAIQGEVKRFPEGLPIPHVGWNRVDPVNAHPLFAGLSEGNYFYFTHSYFARPEHKENILSLTDYGFSFPSAVINGNLYGVQFHPEKSGSAGLRLLSNFGKIIADQQ